MIKLVLTDIDGVWTDGGMYYDQTGNELKKFHTYDSAGVIFLQKLNIPFGIITGEETLIVENRAKKLGVELLFQGIHDKLKTVLVLCKSYDIKISEVAYIGDDINDYTLLQNVGFSACPSNAPSYIKSIVNFVTEKKGGEGAFREFVEKIIEHYHLANSIIDLINDKHQTS